MKKKSDKMPPAISTYALSEIKRKIDLLKQMWTLFAKNKIWILSLLFAASIIHSTIHYGMYGINILEYATISDIFVNFAFVFMPIVILLILSFFLYLFPNVRNKRVSIILLIFKVFLLLFVSVIISRLFNNVFGGGLLLLYVIGICCVFYFENRKAFVWLCILMIFMVSFIEPIEKRNTPIINRISFKYSNIEYNLADIEKYYYIGGSSDYYFIFIKTNDIVQIIPRNECQDIFRPVIHWDDLWKNDETRSNSPVFRINRKHKKKDNVVTLIETRDVKTGEKETEFMII